MAEIVNLRRVKKARAAAERAAQAQQNRVLHGRTKAERARDVLAREQAEKRAEGSKLDDEPPSG